MNITRYVYDLLISEGSLNKEFVLAMRSDKKDGVSLLEAKRRLAKIIFTDIQEVNVESVDMHLLLDLLTGKRSIEESPSCMTDTLLEEAAISLERLMYAVNRRIGEAASGKKTVVDIIKEEVDKLGEIN